MERVVGIKIPFINQVYFLKTNQEHNSGDYIIIKSNNGNFLCEVASKTEIFKSRHQLYKNSEFLREATNDDIKEYSKSVIINNKYLNDFKNATKKLNIPIECTGVWPSIDGKYVKFFYYATQPVAFNKLIPELLKNISRKIRVELVQIGSREYNAILGGFGVCGYELCCHNRSYSTPSITTSSLKYIGYRIDLKDQLFGNCGKYKCCLLFEAEEYIDFTKNLPDYYEKIIFNDIEYTVMDLNIFNKIVTLQSKQEKIEIHYDEFTKVYNGNNT